MDFTSLRLSLWDDPVLRNELIAWVEGRLAERGAHLLPEPPRVRVRPWSATARFATSLGPVWFKANAPGAEFEAALAGALYSWVPGRVLTPLGVDVKRGWTLTPDGGTSLRDQMGALDDFAVWEALLTTYGEVQRALGSRVRDLLALDVPDLRPAALGRRLDGFLASPGVARVLGDDHDALIRRRAEFDDRCRALAESGVGVSIDHSDLHVGNVFVQEGGYRFADWGDAAVAHPFTSLMVPLRFVARELGADARTVARLRDAYLEPWTGDHTLADLRVTVRRATSLAPVNRALAWSRCFPELRPQVAPEEDTQQALWLRLLLKPTPPLPL
ncbi:phosphotransferase family protein [Nocardiopsis trehalosi]|uniref:phosphotransferase n=1 Tax=Nocardiopsis trehalosi TaxID=109329 RepID=UPI001FDF73E6|nr:phosphotransferase [Nocardiopsis trehalosi]